MNYPLFVPKSNEWILETWCEKVWVWNVTGNILKLYSGTLDFRTEVITEKDLSEEGREALRMARKRQTSRDILNNKHKTLC